MKTSRRGSTGSSRSITGHRRSLASEVPGPYPLISPDSSGLLDVGDGQSVYWEAVGRPQGVPAVVLHGGPGSGCTPNMARLFDPNVYRVVMLDQRGSGRSHPRVGADTDLSTNTTSHLVADLECLRSHLGIDRWVVTGVSWGSTLALVYAQAHPDRVAALVLWSVALTRAVDIDWLYHGMGRYYPEEHARFRAGVPDGDRDTDLVAAYHRLLHEPADPMTREAAARSWCEWEDAASPLPDATPNPRYADPEFRMTFARIVTHYFHHRAWLAEDQILRDTPRLAGIPGHLVHGRLDLGSPLDGAWQLAQAWKDATLEVVPTGHTGGAPMTTAVMAALERFGSNLSDRQATTG